MKKNILFISVIFMFIAVQIPADAQRKSMRTTKTRPNVDRPEVPSVSAYEAYIKYGSGKTILIHAGGESFEKRHILGALDINYEALKKGQIKLPNFPKKGIEIFTYCY